MLVDYPGMLEQEIMCQASFIEIDTIHMLSLEQKVTRTYTQNLILQYIGFLVFWGRSVCMVFQSVMA